MRLQVHRCAPPLFVLGWVLLSAAIVHGSDCGRGHCEASDHLLLQGKAKLTKELAFGADAAQQKMPERPPPGKAEQLSLLSKTRWAPVEDFCSRLLDIVRGGETWIEALLAEAFAQGRRIVPLPLGTDSPELPDAQDRDVDFLETGLAVFLMIAVMMVIVTWFAMSSQPLDEASKLPVRPQAVYAGKPAGHAPRPWQAQRPAKIPENSPLASPPCSPRSQPEPSCTPTTSGRKSAASSIASTSGLLCPAMVVPDGKEFVFAVPKVLETHPQSLTFDIVDMTGAPLQRVSVEETGMQPQMRVEAADGTLLASVNTPWASSCQEGLEICKPCGTVFCSLVRASSSAVQRGRYDLKAGNDISGYDLVSLAGQRLLSFRGDFRAKATAVVNPAGQLVCSSERCLVDFSGCRHYQVRVGPGVDAMLALCGLLGIDKLEGPSSARQPMKPPPNASPSRTWAHMPFPHLDEPLPHVAEPLPRLDEPLPYPPEPIPRV